MPFYIRTRPRHPLWHLAAWGAGPMLVWAVGQVVLLPRSSAIAQLSVVELTLLVLAFTVVGGAVASALSWALATPLLRRSPPLRLLTGAIGVGIYITTFTVAAGLAVPSGPWSRVGRSSFILSTGLVSLVLGWVIANDPFDLAKTTERVYLSPSEFNALPPSDQAQLMPEATAATGPGDSGDAG